MGDFPSKLIRPPSVRAEATLQRMIAHASGHIDAFDVHELLDPVIPRARAP